RAAVDADVVEALPGVEEQGLAEVTATVAVDVDGEEGGDGAVARGVDVEPRGEEAGVRAGGDVAQGDDGVGAGRVVLGVEGVAGGDGDGVGAAGGRAGGVPPGEVDAGGDERRVGVGGDGEVAVGG